MQYYTKIFWPAEGKKLYWNVLVFKLQLSSSVNNMFEYLINSTLGIMCMVE